MGQTVLSHDLSVLKVCAVVTAVQFTQFQNSTCNKSLRSRWQDALHITTQYASLSNLVYYVYGAEVTSDLAKCDLVRVISV